ncbi:MAG: hypothetical protein A3B38_04090 [Candidatus Levybacteria bacterium RIFCSPLOWO2_01_FULL_36_13]|nr:MAG: hypothetical protein A2684_01015 [Candidatus Levybacteria bacterium RIFCSPHIGHO2_01_FULL_36_15b]OGH34307.1 MAG: hypothetical protein A3B38_04090 [Candidatus Levybacteria bacterium RIFCSPLOWO2_01_FULL_36_13]
MYKLSPSDFAYLYEECKLCYYLKAKGLIDRPRALMPGVFNAINSRVQGSLVGKNLKSIFADLSDGEIVSQEGFIESKSIPGTSVFIKGKYDLLMKNPDNTYTIIDLKLSQPGEDKGEKYMTQLASYKFAFENPKMGEPIKISGHALLIFYPDKVMYKDGVVLLDFPHTWMNVKIDDQAFLNFMKDIDKLLEGPEPQASSTCKWCEYRESSRKPKFVTDELPF